MRVLSLLSLCKSKELYGSLRLLLNQTKFFNPPDRRPTAARPPPDRRPTPTSAAKLRFSGTGKTPDPYSPCGAQSATVHCLLCRPLFLRDLLYCTELYSTAFHCKSHSKHDWAVKRVLKFSPGKRRFFPLGL
jgi:hypothetical protein